MKESFNPTQDYAQALYELNTFAFGAYFDESTDIYERF